MMNLGKNDRAIVNFLNDMHRSGKNTHPAMEGIGNTMMNHVKAGFRRGESPDGQPWARLKHRSGQPLRDTGALQNSFTQKAGNNEVTIGTPVCYAVVHQEGAIIKAPVPAGKTSLCGYAAKGSPYLRFRVGGTLSNPVYAFAKSVTIPARPFMPEDDLPDDWSEDILDVTVQHFVSQS